MKNKVYILGIALLLLNFPAYSLEKETSKTLTPVAQIKGSVSDYRMETINIDWWTEFNDTLLSDYIAKALQANHDVKIAALRVSEYQQIVKATFGEQLPVVGIGGDLTVQKYSKNYIPLFSGTVQNYTFPLTASYELDLWGKNKDKTLSAKQQLETIKYDEKGALISIASEVASVYMNILKTNKDIQLQKEFIELKKERIKLFQARVNHGVATNDVVITRKKELADANISLHDSEKKLGALKTALAVLTGESPENIADFKFGSIDNIEKFSNFTDKIKSDKILKRPDILKAEAQLNKAKIDIKIARKEFLPDINLTGQAGFNSTTFSKVFDSNSFVYGFGGSIAEFLFTGGRRKANLKYNKLYYDQMLESYQKTILVSLKEVNDSLLNIKSSNQKTKEQLQKLNLEKENLKLVEARYKEGTISYLDTLEPKEKLITLQKDLIQSKTDNIIDNFSLYKALGANF